MHILCFRRRKAVWSAEGEDDEIQLSGQQRQLVRAVAALLAVHLGGCGGKENLRYQGLGSHTVRIDVDEEERNIRNYLVIMAVAVRFAAIISWRLRAVDLPRTATWSWSTTMSLTSNIWTWTLHRVHRGQVTEGNVKEEEIDLQPYR